MQYGFVINQDTCIGCHACTVACKAENDVPVGGFRTNVKYVEVGKYPQVKRHFLVQRCNHCTDAPCVTICPVNALSKRKDGIVDIDRDACIGCRACMQACPYDALYLNEDLGAVEKCHFCAHRVEKGLEPACVTVCPVGAIIPGDFDDPGSRVSLLRQAQTLTVRRPEQGTGPNVMYIGASDVALRPGSAQRDSRLQIWGQRRQTKPEPWPRDVGTEPDAREVMNADHKVEWGWPVALYLLTKGIAGGTAMLAPFLPWLVGPGSVPWWYPETVTLVFTAITVFLLIEDLKKPLHFYKLFTRPNWKSWLVKGGIVLTAFGAVTAGILLLGLIGPPVPIGLIGPLRWANCFLGAATAAYTAFLFWQCKGRDLWESKWLLPHLLVQAAFCGAMAFWALTPMARGLTFAVLGAGILHLMFVIHDLQKHGTESSKQGAGFLRSLRIGSVPVVSISVFLLMIGPPLGPIGAVVSLAGLFLFESAYIRAGQLPPLS